MIVGNIRVIAANYIRTREIYSNGCVQYTNVKRKFFRKKLTFARSFDEFTGHVWIARSAVHVSAKREDRRINATSPALDFDRDEHRRRKPDRETPSTLFVYYLFMRRDKF